MTAHYIAKFAQKALDNMDISKTENNPSLERFNYAVGLLEEYIKCNYLTFETTELVYRFAKNLCIRKNNFENWYRKTGWLYGDKLTALKKLDMVNPKGRLYG